MMDTALVGQDVVNREQRELDRKVCKDVEKGSESLV